MKEKQIAIRSVIENLDEAGLLYGEPEIHESTVRGTLTHGEEGYILSYREVQEGVSVETTIRIEGARVTVCRRGGIESEMVFAEGESHVSRYGIPPYAFDMTLTTQRIRLALDDEGGTLALHYRMILGGQEKLCRMKVAVL